MNDLNRPGFRKKWFARMSACAWILALGGCGSNAESTVSGRVTLDGAALDHGSVMFVPTSHSGRAASGSIDSDGDYEVQAGQTGGMPAGEYRVKVSARAAPKPDPGGGPPTPGKLIIPERYGNTDTSGLEFAVEAGSNNIDLELASE